MSLAPQRIDDAILLLGAYVNALGINAHRWHVLCLFACGGLQVLAFGIAAYRWTAAPALASAQRTGLAISNAVRLPLWIAGSRQFFSTGA